MLSGVWLVVAVLAAIVLTWWVTFTVTRIGRLYVRTEAAQASMDAQLVRRAAALAIISETAMPALGAPEALRLRTISQRALVASPKERQAAENDVSRAIAGFVEAHSGTLVLDGPDGAELAEACARAAIARRFYNDAARDTRSLLSARMPRYLRLARGRDRPQFFDIEDAPRWAPPSTAPAEAAVPTETTVPTALTVPAFAPDPITTDDPALMEATDRA
ncbi:MAG: hypothetical protein JWN61_2059 [Pseudonocardiales bacterium]|nr:hypothetical protein [Pseudonocardiales bacterium]